MGEFETNTPGIPVILTVSGADSSGAAGVQADNRTIDRLNARALNVLTLLTAQNAGQLSAAQPVSAAFMRDQMEACWAEAVPGAIKVGALADDKQLDVLIDNLLARDPDRTIPLVVDPVQFATSGARLGEPVDLMPLIRLSAVVTPNWPELAALTDRTLTGMHEVREAAIWLLDEGAAAVIVKGGHAPDTRFPEPEAEANDDWCTDWLFARSVSGDSKEQIHAVRQKRVDSVYSRGTGCTYASVISVALAKGYPLKDAIVLAQAFIGQGMSDAGLSPVTEKPKASGYAGKRAIKKAGISNAGKLGVRQTHWPSQLDSMPSVSVTGWSPILCSGPQASFRFASGFADCGSMKLGLYPVVDSADWVEKLIGQGVSTIQIRIKSGTGSADQADLKIQLQRAVALARQASARLFINDHWQLAIELGAYGVHLGQEDLLSADFQAIQKAGLRLGLSTHGYYEMLCAHQFRPSYMAIGAIYHTETKDMSGQLQGLDRLQSYVDLFKDHYPLVAIGGIDIERAPAVKKTGVGSIAVVRAITQAPDWRTATQTLLAIASE